MEDFVTFDIANKLKEKGFKEQCLAYYTKDSGFYYNTSYGSDVENAFKSFNSRPNHICGKRIDAPTISQVLKWLREKGVDIYCTPNWHNKTDKYYVVCIVRDRIYNHGAYIDDNDFSTYEKAALAGIEYVLDNLI